MLTRETLLGQLSVYIKQTRDNFMQQTHAGGKGIPKGKNVPEAVNNISWVQQLIAKVWNNLCVHVSREYDTCYDYYQTG